MSNPDENPPSNVDEDYVLNEDEDLMENSNAQSISRRGKRSTAKCLKTAKKIAAGTKLEITFNDKGQPIGDNAIEFGRFLAQKTRDMVKISYKSWPSVPKELKLDLYNSIAQTWNIPDDIPVLIKKKILTACCNRWRAWKVRLNKKYRENAQEDGAKPWDVLNISQEEWNEFDEYLQSPQFEKMSKIGHENAAKKDMPHTLGSGGYISAEKTWKKGEVVHGATSTISMEVDNRSYRWSRARATQDSETGELRVKNPKACEVIDKAVALAKSGEIQAVRQNDILTAALGTSEHSGRLRGYPIYSGVNQVFGKGTRKSKRYTKDEIDQIVHEEVERRLAEEVKRRLPEEVSKTIVRQIEQSFSRLFSQGQTPQNAYPIMNQAMMQSFSRLFSQGQTSQNLDPIMNQAMILQSQGSNNQPHLNPGPNIQGPMSMANNIEISNEPTSIHNEQVSAPPGFSPLLSPKCARSSGSETSFKVCHNQGESSKIKNLKDMAVRNRDEEVASDFGGGDQACQQSPPCMDTSRQTVRGKGNMVAPIAHAVHAKFSVKAEPFSGTQNLNPHPTAQSSGANAPDPRRMPPHFRVLGNPSFLSTKRENQFYCLAESMRTGNSDKGGEGSRQLVEQTEIMSQWDRNVRPRIKYGRQYTRPVRRQQSGASRNPSRTQAGSIDSSQKSRDPNVGTGTDENKSEGLASSAGWEDKSSNTEAAMLPGESTTEASVSYGWDESSSS